MQSRGKQINRTPKVAKSKRLEEINEKHFFDTFSEETPHEDITLANHNGIPKESPEDAARRALNAQKELERLKALQSQKEDEEKCAKKTLLELLIHGVFLSLPRHMERCKLVILPIRILAKTSKLVYSQSLMELVPLWLLLLKWENLLLSKLLK
jgi:hypothetical protein